MSYVLTGGYATQLQERAHAFMGSTGLRVRQRCAGTCKRGQFLVSNALMVREEWSREGGGLGVLFFRDNGTKILNNSTII